MRKGKGSTFPVTAAQQQGKISNRDAAVKVELAGYMQPQFYQPGEKAMKVMCMVPSGIKILGFFLFVCFNLSYACWP